MFLVFIITCLLWFIIELVDLVSAKIDGDLVIQNMRKFLLLGLEEISLEL